MVDFLVKLNGVLSKDDKRGLFYLFLFSILIAIIETVGVSVIMPYISVANDFSLIETNKYYEYAFDILDFSNYVDFVIFLGFSLIVFYIFRALINALYIYKIISFTQISYHKIVNKLFSNYLNMPYKNFINKNNSTLLKVNNPFGDRICIGGKTNQLVNYCEFCIAHLSTSINFAVLYSKSVVFISMKEIEYFFSDFIEKFAKEIGNKKFYRMIDENIVWHK